jgi:hypothetical protein
METIISIKPLIAVLVSICVVPLLVMSKRANIGRPGPLAPLL